MFRRHREIATSAGQGVLIALAAMCPAAVQAAESAKAPAATQSVALPGGASALTETHGNWTVNCQVAGDIKTCSFSHQQFDTSNNQRLLAIELSARNAENAVGTIALPFGLSLAQGVSLQIDETKIDGVFSFSTCFVVGCLVPVSFDQELVKRAKAGTTLKIEAIAYNTGQPLSFAVPLLGFGSAIARVAALSAD